LREPSRISGWRTAVIIEELEHEVRTQNTRLYRETLKQILTLEEALRKLDLKCDKERAEVQNIGHEIQEELARKRQLSKQIFNPYFGSVFRTHTNATIFAYMLQRYADIYTSKLENFDLYPLDFVHHAEREFLSHERSVRYEMVRALGQDRTPPDQQTIQLK
jgi:hypothetical protein